MTVSELIETLINCKPDAEVKLEVDFDRYCIVDIDSLIISEDQEEIYLTHECLEKE